MRIENSPASYGWLAALVVLLAGLVLNASCLPRTPGGRSAQIAFESAVLIEVHCATERGGSLGYGSGVIVNSTTVITAKHVATHDGVCVYTALMSNLKRYVLYVDKLAKDADIATLRTFGTFAPSYPITYGDDPPLGTRVCMQAAFPRWAYACGERAPSQAGVLAFPILVEPGNSGSGLYDDRGRLVGIVTELVMCSNGQICAGRAALLKEHLHELL